MRVSSTIESHWSSVIWTSANTNVADDALYLNQKHTILTKRCNVIEFANDTQIEARKEKTILAKTNNTLYSNSRP